MMRHFYCLRCGKETVRPRQCLQQICKKCSQEHYAEGQAARHIVSAAIKQGKLLSAKTKICVDCGKGANVHDHSDYTKPLDVEPVCFSCNALRGMAMDSKLRVRPNVFLDLSKRRKVPAILQKQE